MAEAGDATRILVLRRDNIGDLVCTTPLLSALRAQLPASFIVALVNRYNEPVLHGNPDLDAVHSYQKAKHRGPDESLAGVYWRRLKTMAELRRQRFHWLLLPGGMQAGTASAVRMIAPRRVLVRAAEDALAGAHEVEQGCHLLARMGLRYETPPQRVVPDPAIRERLAARLQARLGFSPARVIGVHVSARKASQRWPAAGSRNCRRVLSARHRLPLYTSSERSSTTRPRPDRRWRGRSASSRAQARAARSSSSSPCRISRS